jgi:hypothetical protein
VCGVKGGVMSACSLLVFIGYDVPWCGSLVSDACSLIAAMPDKRMRPIVKQETGSDCAQEMPQQQPAAAAAGERDGQHHRVEDEGGVELGLQLLRANVEVQAIALQWMERERAIAEQLLQAQAQVAELRAEIRIKDAALEAKDATHKAKFASLESELQSKEAALQAHIFGRYAAPGKHLVSGPYTPPPPTSTSRFKLTNFKKRPRATAVRICFHLAAKLAYQASAPKHQPPKPNTCARHPND